MFATESKSWLGTLLPQHRGYRRTVLGGDLDQRAGLILAARALEHQIGPHQRGDYLLEDDSLGDVIGSFLWPTAGRPIPAWRFGAWPILRTEADDETSRPAPLGAQLQTANRRGRTVVGQGPKGAESWLPVLNDDYDEDERFRKLEIAKPKISVSVALNPGSRTSRFGEDEINAWPRFPLGWHGIGMAGDEENEQNDVIGSVDPRMVAVNTEADEDSGSRIVDLRSDDSVNAKRMARLHQAFRVLEGPVRIGDDDGSQAPKYDGKVPVGALTWNIHRSGGADRLLGGLLYGKATGSSEGVVATLARSWGGPFDPGRAGDIHDIGSIGDDTRINQGGISGDALYRFGPSGDLDAPQKHDGVFSPGVGGIPAGASALDVSSGGLAPVSYVFDPAETHSDFLGRQHPGRHRWFCAVPDEESTPDITITGGDVTGGGPPEEPEPPPEGPIPPVAPPLPGGGDGPIFTGPGRRRVPPDRGRRGPIKFPPGTTTLPDPFGGGLEGDPGVPGPDGRLPEPRSGPEQGGGLSGAEDIGKYSRKNPCTLPINVLRRAKAAGAKLHPEDEKKLKKIDGLYRSVPDFEGAPGHGEGHETFIDTARARGLSQLFFRASPQGSGEPNYCQWTGNGTGHGAKPPSQVARNWRKAVSPVVVRFEAWGKQGNTVGSFEYTDQPRGDTSQTRYQGVGTSTGGIGIFPPETSLSDVVADSRRTDESSTYLLLSENVALNIGGDVDTATGETKNGWVLRKDTSTDALRIIRGHGGAPADARTVLRLDAADNVLFDFGVSASAAADAGSNTGVIAIADHGGAEPSSTPSDGINLWVEGTDMKIKTDDGTDWVLNAATDLHRPKYAGTALETTDFALIASGWGTGASVSSVDGTDAAFRVQITAGSSPTASPSLTLTYKDGAFGTAPFAIVQRTGGNDTSLSVLVATTTTTVLTVTMSGTPTNGNTTILTGHLFDC